jgi:tetratricopeptide (TPR) repeat protein
VEAAYRQVLALQIDSARAQLKAVPTGIHIDPMFIYTSNLADVLDLMLLTDAQMYATIKYREKEYLSAIAQLKDDDPWKLHLQGEVLMYWSLVRFKYHEYFSAFWTLRQASAKLTRNQKQFPDFLPTQKSVGTMQVLLGTVPQQYHWLLTMAGMEGDARAGYTLLRLSDLPNNPLRMESALLAAVVDAYLFQRMEEAEAQLSVLHAQTPNSLLLSYVYASVLMKNHSGAKALALLEHALAQEHSARFAPLLYLCAEAKLQAGAYRQANALYTRFLQVHPDGNLKADVHYKMAVCHQQLGEAAMASQRLREVLSFDHTDAEADQYAQAVAASGMLPAAALSRARYATDGGYQAQAARALESISPDALAHRADTVEYWYRKARLHHQVGDMPQAIRTYEKVIALQGTAPWYFAPGAHLYLGYIVRDKDKARMHLKAVADYANHPYQQSLRRKARLALEVL